MAGFAVRFNESVEDVDSAVIIPMGEIVKHFRFERSVEPFHDCCLYVVIQTAVMLGVPFFEKCLHFVAIKFIPIIRLHTLHWNGSIVENFSKSFSNRRSTRVYQWNGVNTCEYVPMPIVGQLFHFHQVDLIEIVYTFRIGF